MTSELLVVRGAELVFFAVDYVGCAIDQDRLTATEDGAHLVVTFPPQSIVFAGVVVPSFGPVIA